jgi:hypothetical protein
MSRRHDHFDPFAEKNARRAVEGAKERLRARKLGSSTAFMPKEVRVKQQIAASRTRRQKSRPETLPSIRSGNGGDA